MKPSANSEFLDLPDALAKSPHYLEPHKPCAECPFRNTAAPGWFGPYNADFYWSSAHSDALVQCHMTSANRNARKHRHCTGVALHRSLTCKRMPSPEQHEHQQECVDRYGTEGILGFDFKTYHAKRVWK